MRISNYLVGAQSLEPAGGVVDREQFDAGEALKQKALKQARNENRIKAGTPCSLSHSRSSPWCTSSCHNRSRLVEDIH
jgi:hypothetical protein